MQTSWHYHRLATRRSAEVIKTVLCHDTSSQVMTWVQWKNTESCVNRPCHHGVTLNNEQQTFLFSFYLLLKFCILFSQCLVFLCVILFVCTKMTIQAILILTQWAERKILQAASVKDGEQWSLWPFIFFCTSQNKVLSLHEKALSHSPLTIVMDPWFT